MSHDHQDPFQPHSHDPNPEPPGQDAAFDLYLLDGEPLNIDVASLRTLPQSEVPAYSIVSTGHGSSGPFTFHGPTLLALLQHYVVNINLIESVEVLSADGFGNRVWVRELLDEEPAGSIILATAIDGASMTRAQGLVRLIVPNETDDALRQVKWVGSIRCIGPSTTV